MPEETKPSSPTRLLSLDALRGFDMFWIVGAEDIVHALHNISHTGIVNLLATQLTHKDWRGVAFYDLIFPLFVFIVGVSLVFSLSRIIEREGRAAALKRVFWRALLLYLVGVFYYGGIGRGWDMVRWMGVLQRIAIAYFFAGALFCVLRRRGLAIASAGLLIGYWALMALVPIRDISLEKSNLARLASETGVTNATTLFQNTTNRVTGAYDEGRNLANHIDFQYLPGRKWDGAYDPEGLLSNLPAVATCLLGVLMGLLLRNESVTPQKKVRWLLCAGLAGVVLGFGWGLGFPVIKKIWTSSYVLVAGGYSCLFLAAFYQVIEIWKWQKWATPFVWIGMNPLAVYLLHNLVDLNGLAARLAGGPIKAGLGNWGQVVITMLVLAASFLFARFLYRRKIFLRL